MNITCRVYRAVPWLLAGNAALNIGYTTEVVPGWTSLLLLAAAVAVAFTIRAHVFRGRCETTCFTRQPVDGPTMHGLDVGARWHRAGRALGIAGMVLIVAMIVGAFLRAFTDHGAVWLVVVMPVWMLAVAGEIYANQQHERSWCPICWRRGWDDDDHDLVPDPDPSTSAHIH